MSLKSSLLAAVFIAAWFGSSSACDCTVPVRVNSPDSNADCGVDSGDLVRFASHLGSREGEPRYSFCFDFNADGGVDQSDLCILASVYSTVCR
jgi:dockerin type I repeat protein